MTQCSTPGSRVTNGQGAATTRRSKASVRRARLPRLTNAWHASIYPTPWSPGEAAAAPTLSADPLPKALAKVYTQARTEVPGFPGHVVLIEDRRRRAPVRIENGRHEIIAVSVNKESLILAKVR